MPQKLMECFRLFFFYHLAWIEHQFLSGIRDSRKAGSLWGMMRGVGGVRKSVHQSWLAKGLGFWVEVLREYRKRFRQKRPATLQIGSVEFPPGQCTSPQLHPCHRLFYQDRYQDSSSPLSPDVAPSEFWLFPKLRGCRYEDNWADERSCDEG